MLRYGHTSYGGRCSGVRPVLALSSTTAWQLVEFFLEFAEVAIEASLNGPSDAR